MLNLVHWRQRASRQRSLWLVRWCALLAVSLAIVTGSIAVALESLQRDVPDHADALQAVLQSNLQLQSDIDAIDQQIATDRANRAALLQVQADMQQRIAQWNRWLADRPLRVLSFEQTRSDLRLTIQAASPSVLSDLMAAPNATIVSIRAADSGQLIEVHVNATARQ